MLIIDTVKKAIINQKILSLENGKQITTWKALGLSIKEATKSMLAFLTTNPVGWAVLAAGAIGGLAIAFDIFHESSKEANEAMDDSVSSYNIAKDELDSLNKELENNKKKIDELNDKGKLTYAEQGQLEELREITKELEIQADIAERNKEKKSVETVKKTVNAYDKQYGKYGTVSKDRVNELVNDDTNIYSVRASSTDDIVGNIAELVRLQALVDETKEKLSNTKGLSQKQIDVLGEDFTRYTNLVREVTGNLETTIEDLSNKQQNLKDQYTLAINKQSKGEILTNDEKDFISRYETIENAIKLIYEYTNPNVWNQIQFDDIFNTEGIEKTKEELISMVQAGKLDEKTLESYPVLSEAISSLNLITEDGTDIIELFIDQLKAEGEEAEKAGEKVARSFSKEEMISAINKMSEGFEELDKIMTSIKDKDKAFDYALLDNDKFKNTFSGLDSYADFIETIGKSPKDIDACNEAFDNLVSEWIDSVGILDKVNEGNANIAKTMLELMGVTNAAALVDAELVKQKYEVSLASWAARDTAYEEIEAFYDEIDATDEARDAMNKFYLEKLTVNGLTVKTTGDIQNIMNLVKACGGGVDALQALANAKNGIFQYGPNQNPAGFTSEELLADSMTKSGNIPLPGSELGQAFISYQDKVKNYTNDIYKKAQAEIQKTLDADYANTDYNGPKSTDKSGGGSGGDKGSKAFDWIERRLKLLEEKRSELESKSSSSFLSYLGLDENTATEAKALLDKMDSGLALTGEEMNSLSMMASKAGMSMTEFMDAVRDGDFNSRQSAIAGLIALDKEALNQYKIAVDEYQKEYDEAASKLSDDLRYKVENGGVNIEEYSGEEKENIEKAIDAFDKLNGTKKKLDETQEQLTQHTKQSYDNEVEYLDKQQERLNAQNSLAQKHIDYLEASGQIVNASTYENLIANLKSQEAILEKKLEKRRQQLQEMLESGGIEEGSKDYYDLLNQIDDIELSLKDCTIQQEEFNNEMLQMPIKNAEFLAQMFDDISTAIENYGNEMEAAGKKVDAEYYQVLIDNGMQTIDQLKEQADAVRDVMNEYDTGSTKWQELYSQLQNINSQMSSMVVNLRKWNEELLNMPLNSISSQVDEMNQMLDGLNKVQADYDTVIQAVTDAFEDEKKALEDANKATNEEYQGKIDALNERLELLNKQNEALKLQEAYEQALYELETANTQKTERVIRDGQVVYETNAERIKDAQEGVQDALADLEAKKIQDEMDGLQEELDKINETYEKQIEALDEIANKWLEIKENVEKAQNAQKADEVLGEGWKDKVLSGNDADIYEAFKSNYETNAASIQKLEKQIETTENILALLNNYIVAYKEGILTYEQAMMGINSLLSQMNTEMSSGKNIQNILDYLGQMHGTNADVDSVLGGIGESLKEFADQMRDSMEMFEQNSGMIDAYQTSWEKLTEDVTGIRDLMDDVIDNFEDAIDAIENIDIDSGRRDEDEFIEDTAGSIADSIGNALDKVGDHFGKGESSNVIEAGKGQTVDKDHQYTGSHPRGDDYEDDDQDVNHGPGVRSRNIEVEVTVKEKEEDSRADGIKRGAIGTKSNGYDVKILKALATRNLEPSEVPIIAHKGEVVLNPDQQKMLLKNFNSNLGNVDAITSKGTGNIEVTMGDIILPDVTDPDGFARAMKSEFESAMRQALGKDKLLIKQIINK